MSFKHETNRKKGERVKHVFNVLHDLYPDVGTFLTHENPFQLLIAVILSAQCTDKRVNMVTPDLFARFPDPLSFMKGNLDEIKHLISSINFFNNKAMNIHKTCHLIIEKYEGEIPNTLSELIKLPGVGRKTANVVLGQAFNIPGITVDTHVGRVSNRLGFTTHTDPVKSEMDLNELWPEALWIEFSSTMILHGRDTCKAQKPACPICPIKKYCPYPLLK